MTRIYAGAIIVACLVTAVHAEYADPLVSDQATFQVAAGRDPAITRESADRLKEGKADRPGPPDRVDRPSNDARERAAREAKERADRDRAAREAKEREDKERAAKEAGVIGRVKEALKPYAEVLEKAGNPGAISKETQTKMAEAVKDHMEGRTHIEVPLDKNKTLIIEKQGQKGTITFDWRF
jgi:hypothetical protein